jgi:hypothetical protein
MLFRRTAARWLLLAAPLASISCAKKDKTISDGAEQPAEYSPPREGMTTNLDSLRSYVDTFYHGPLHKRSRAAICTKSAPAGCEVSVTIQAIGRSKDILADSGPSPGRIIGLIQNLDSTNLTQMDSLKPSAQANYYIYIDRAPSGHSRWNLLEVPQTPTGVIRRFTKTEVNQCGERPGYMWPQSDVDFSACGDHALAAVVHADLLTPVGWSHLFSAVANLMRPHTAMAEKGKWYGCPSGCCT